MSIWNEETGTVTVIFEKDINLYDSEEAGKTCQKILVNGREVNIHDFKREKKKGKTMGGSGWLKHGFISR